MERARVLTKTSGDAMCSALLMRSTSSGGWVLISTWAARLTCWSVKDGSLGGRGCVFCRGGLWWLRLGPVAFAATDAKLGLVTNGWVFSMALRILVSKAWRSE